MKAWVFDLDGTLVDSFGHYFVSLGKVFEMSGMKFGDELRLTALTEPLPLFLQRQLGAAQVPAAIAELQRLSNLDAEHIRPFDGAMDLVRALKDRGDHVSVWTNRDFVSADLILMHSGLSKFIDTCVSGTCVENRKPHPEGLRRIMEQFGLAPTQVTMIGDHEHDVTGAKGAGARAVRASWHEYWQMPKCPDADHQFYCFKEFFFWNIPIFFV